MLVTTTITNIPFGYHLAVGLLIRIILIFYSEIQDKYAEVPFTDIDYKVLSDGARHVLNSHSPFERHTYRYTPLLAYLLLPNLIWVQWFGKALFSIIDVVIALIIKRILVSELHATFRANASAILKRNKHLAVHTKKNIRLPQKYEGIAEISALFWLYNPMSAVISTRGNGDSISTFLILVTIYFLQESWVTQKNPLLLVFISGIFHGLAIHFRLYPMAFSLAYYLYLTNKDVIYSNKFFYTIIFRPNLKQLCLISGTVITLTLLTIFFYWMYGYDFLFEAYLYHIIRKDTRHNFSLYFYMQLLNAEPLLLEKLLTFLPQAIILFLVNFHFGWHQKTLGFCIFLQSFVIVSFNPVLTSQYFIWYFAIMPLCLKNLKSIGAKRFIFYGALWLGVQLTWLYSAYLLEFKGWNTFGFIWLQGTLFFCVNGFILKTIISHFDLIADI